MKKIIFSLLVMLFLVGCNLNRGPSASVTEQNIHLGTDGLVINLIDNMPPDLVYEGETFPIGVKLENKGAFDITKGNILLNVEKDVLEPEDIKESLKIKGKSFGNPYGETDTINFLVKANELGKETETMTTNIIITSCYKYQTVFSDTFCVDTDFYNLKKGVKACSAEDKTYGSGQGGPLSITRIESKMSMEDDLLKPVFIIHARNTGRGGIISSDSINAACSEKGVDKESINKLDSIEANFLSEQKALECKSTTSRNMELNEEEIIIRCSLDEGMDDKVEPYTTVLNVVISYGYTETISKSVEIKKIVG